MSFLEYDPEETLEYYLQDDTMLAELSRDGLLEHIEAVFLKNAGYGPYEEAMFLSFLLYTTGDFKRMRTVVTRLYLVLEQDYIPDTPGALLEGWFGGKVPDAAATDSSILEKKLLPGLRELKVIVRKRAREYVDGMIKDFRLFFRATEDELFLESREIHSEELSDRELEEKALRWEYKYLGREEGKIKERWNIYLERQDECPK